MKRQVLITGATGGLGSGVVQYFLAAGYDVLAADVRPEAEDWQERLGYPQNLTYVSLNVTNPEAVRQLAGELEDSGLDVLVNLVGGFQMAGLHEAPVADLEKMLELNVKSTYVMSQGLLSLLKRSSSGRIINVGARQALLGGPNATAYALSKAAVVNFTQSLAAELKSSSVTVNAVVPSTIDTPANRRDMPEADFEAWVQPADLAAVIGFLAGESARAVSGAVIPVYNKA